MGEDMMDVLDGKKKVTLSKGDRKRLKKGILRRIFEFFN
jgi:hypothetical protein